MDSALTTQTTIKFRYSMPKFAVEAHAFTETILEVLKKHFGESAKDILESSPLLGYINSKTKAANRGSKARGAFANHYALYVVIEDYVKKGYKGDRTKDYSKYEGARFSDLFKRQRELPFGAKLQNHALNARLNDEFKKFYPAVNKQPIVRDVEKQRYWIQEDLLLVTIRGKDGKDRTFNIARPVLDIIDAYVATKRAAFEGFLETCRQIVDLGEKEPTKAAEFVKQQLDPSVDARVFEIISYAVLKAHYAQDSVWIGESRDTVEEQVLRLFKTGRTNANDGGIDFVMKPLGRFFQVTETIDVNKYFLDIDKVQRFPMTFVVKSTDSQDSIRDAIRAQAKEKYKIDAVVNSYMDAVEEIINVDGLLSAFDAVVKSGKLADVMNEIVTQSKLEFNYSDADDVPDLQDFNLEDL